MVNDENLIPINQRTKSEQREIQKKGGLASGKRRRQQADLRRAFQTLLRSEVNSVIGGLKAAKNRKDSIIK